MRLILILLLALCIVGGAQAQQLFVGLESDVPAYISDLTGFPDLNWAPLWSFGPSGAAAPVSAQSLR